ncbi:MAG: hypothetical protein ACE5FM_03810 [Methyloligellaceae bacterium]
MSRSISQAPVNALQHGDKHPDRRAHDKATAARASHPNRKAVTWIDFSLRFAAIMMCQG